jgi:hypothetical protein
VTPNVDGLKNLIVGGKAFTSSEYADADTFQAALTAAY